MLALSAELRDKLRTIFRGKVLLVGAGPGDWGLLTLRGAMILSAAEVVIYDHLLDSRELEFISRDAELIYAGKQAGKHELSQDEINNLLVAKARQQKMVVRLKGGDPWIFGRGAEETEFLSSNGIPYEIVPGVSALTAALSAAGIPLTHRKYASSFVVATGHEDAKKSEDRLDYKILSKIPGTIVIFMGVKNVESISAELIKGGREKNEGAALVREGHTPSQKVVCASLDEIAKRAKSEGVKPPALFVVSPTVELKKQMEWFENRPLWGLKIVVTRPLEQASELSLLLELLGAKVIISPAIAIEPLEDFSELDRAIKNISSYSLLVFTSVNGVQHFMSRFFGLGFDTRRLAGVEVAAVGEATASELRKYGVIPDHVPARFTSSSLAEKLASASKRGRALLIRSPLAPQELEDILTDAGFEVTRVEAYRVVDLPIREGVLAELKEGVDWLTFASGSAVKSFSNNLSAELREGLKVRVKILSIGPETSKVIKSIGWGVDCKAKIHTSWGMVQALLECIGSRS